MKGREERREKNGRGESGWEEDERKRVDGGW